MGVCGFVMCGCVYFLVFVMCGCVYVWVCVCLGVFMCGFCNVWVCVCVGFIKCWCYGNMCICMYCVLYCFVYVH